MPRTAVVLVLIVSVAGCSLVDPFVTRDIAPPGLPAPAKPDKPKTETATLDEAFRYAADVKAAYRGAVRDQVQLQAWLGIGLIPLTAAAMGLGATGASPDAVLALGLTGASGLGIGTLLFNKPRQLAWVAGLKAATCAEDAMAPLKQPAGMTTEIKAAVGILRTELKNLETADAALETEIDLARSVRESADTTKPDLVRALKGLESLENAAGAEHKDVQGAVSAAEEALKSGVDLQQLLATSGQRLVVAVSKITDEVDNLVVETQKDPQALANIIAGLGGAYRAITTVPEGIARATDKDKEKDKESKVKPQAGAAAVPPAATPEELKRVQDREDALQAGLNTVRAQRAKTAEARRAVADVVNSIVKDAPVERLKNCGVKTGDLVTALTVDPAPPFTIGKPGSLVFTIKGGLPPYGAGLAGGQSGLIVSPAGPFSPAITVLATKDTMEGQFAVVVTDSSSPSQTKTVPVTVSAGTDKKDADKKDADRKDADALTQLADKLTKDQPPVSANGVTVKITKAKVVGDRVIVSIGDPQVGPDATTADAARAIRDKLAEDFGKPLGVAADKIAFEDPAPLAPEKLEAKKSAPQSGCVDTAAASAPADPLFTTLPEDGRRRLQRAVCLTGQGPNGVDGKWGPVTRGKVMLYQCRQRKPQDGVLTRDLVTELLSLNEEKIRQLCRTPR
jgi:hypothetical protein